MAMTSRIFPLGLRHGCKDCKDCLSQTLITVTLECSCQCSLCLCSKHSSAVCHVTHTSAVCHTQEYTRAAQALHCNDFILDGIILLQSSSVGEHSPKLQCTRLLVTRSILVTNQQSFYKETPVPFC